MGRKALYKDYDPANPLPNPTYEKLVQLSASGLASSDAMQQAYPDKNYNAERARRNYSSLLADNPAVRARLQFLKADNERLIGDNLRRKTVAVLDSIISSDTERSADRIRAAEALNRMQWLDPPGKTTAGPPRAGFQAVQVNIGSPASPVAQDEDWLELVDKLNSPAQVVDARTVSGSGILDAELVK